MKRSCKLVILGAVAVVVTAWIGVVPALAQLSAEDIAALQRQGEEEGWTFTVGENPATRRSLDELCGLVVPDNWWVGARFDPCTPMDGLPEAFNWCDEGGCTPVKSQGSCGSCWAFGTVGPLESNILIKDGTTEDLSEQWLVSCNRDGWGCNGGWWAHDYHEWKTDPCGDTGAVMEADFPYVARDAPCECPYPHEYLLDDWRYIGSQGGIPPLANIKQAILDYGPVSAAVYANSAMQAYGGGIFDGCASGQVNHAVVLVGWDDNQGPSGIWFMRNSWGPGWGEEGYMRIPYGCSSIGYSANYIDYAGRVTLRINLPDGVPETVLPGEPTVIPVQIEELGDELIPGTGQLYYRYEGQKFLTSPLVHVSGDMYEATLPPAKCGQTPEYYFGAEGEQSGAIYNPKNAPDSTYSSLVGELITVFADNFETDKGWSVVNSPALTAGAWVRVVPSQGGGPRGDPQQDYDGSGKCFVTGNGFEEDIDDGTTYLTSPRLDLSGGDASISYARWYSNDFGNDPHNDIFVVDVSDNDGNDWTTAEVVGPGGPEASGGWHTHRFNVAEFVSPSDKVRVRFTASDLHDGSVVEGGVDAFEASRLTCAQEPIVCDDVKKFTGKCTRRGKVRAKVILTDVSHVGQTVTIAIDGSPYEIQVKGKKAKLKECCFEGLVVISLEDPPDCVDPIETICP